MPASVSVSSQPTGLYQPDKRTIGELLATTSPPIAVPAWQRSFSWTESHVDAFWNDLLDFERRNPPDATGLREYFLGSVVIVATGTKEHLLLDGQQRLATSAILLSVIRDFTKKYKEDTAKRIEARYLADVDDARNVVVYKLALNVYDRDFFRRKILEYREGSYQEPEPTQASHRLIAGARAYFESKFEERYTAAETPEKAFQWALRIQDVLTNHMSVVAVSSSDEDHAAEVFETLNDRGIGLSTPDLLRNLVMRRAPVNVRDDIVTLWGEIIEFDTDTEIKGFLRHYWISHHGDIKTQRLYREIKKFIEDNNTDSLIFSRELRDASISYRDIVAARDDNADIQSCLKDVEILGASVLYPVILSIMECAGSDQQAPLLRVLINVYVRHSVVGQLENSKLENVIHKIAVDLRHGLPVEDAKKILRDFAPADKAFQAAFQGLSLSRTATQRYLLMNLEHDRRTTEELVVNVPQKVHVEHIYPQSPAEGERWQNHALSINRLGNLTLLAQPLNTAAKNAAFGDKKTFYKKSEILIASDLCSVGGWSPDQIEQRQNELSKRAVLIWPLNS
jgi:uncharacterized protein with ParB-like and HNH nuclease domain